MSASSLVVTYLPYYSTVLAEGSLFLEKIGDKRVSIEAKLVQGSGWDSSAPREGQVGDLFKGFLNLPFPS